jgi:hypothetical protein
MPTKARAERRRVRDAIGDIAFEVAEHVAGGEMISVERDPEGGVKFSRRVLGVSGYYCDCGLPLTPLPQFHSRFGVLPCWVCGVCSLEEIIKFADRARREAIVRAAQKSASAPERSPQ